VDENKIKISLPEESGELLLCGGTNWSVNARKVPRKTDMKYEKVGKNLWKPHRYKAMSGIKVARVASGCLSSHSVLITAEGKVYSWGRNEFGQLGHGDLARVDVPKPIETLQSYKVVHAATGKNHTLCLTENGHVFAFGDNTHGQLGLGSTSATGVPSPSLIQYKGDPIVQVSCGSEFSCILDCEGAVHSFGLPEYGQLGNNTDGKYLAKGNKWAFDVVKAPFRIPLWIEKVKGQASPLSNVKITSIACGANHVVALDSKKRVFTWGFGGYGRLGHSEQKDEHTPRLVEIFARPGRGALQVYAGFSNSYAKNEQGMTMHWGIQGNAGTRESTMYPKGFQDLMGWHVRSLAAGRKHTIVAADDSVICWGSGTAFGELGLGEGRKSSARPDLMKTIAGVYIHQVSCGEAHTLMIARNDNDEDKKLLDNLPQYDPVMIP